MAAVDPIVVTVEVPVTPDVAFIVFTARLGGWWPAEYTWSGDVLALIAIEPRVGGRCFERGPERFECDWGKVIACEPPERLAFRWQIDPQRVPVPDPAKASEVEVTFSEAPGGATGLQLVHSHFDRHGDGGEAYRDALASPQGWPFILERYAAALAG